MEVIKLVNSIFFYRSIPKKFVSEYFNTQDNSFMIDKVLVEVNLKEKTKDEYVNAITFSSEGDRAQQVQDSFLRWLKGKIDLEMFVWAYQLEVEVKEKVNLRKIINLPSVLPLVGSVLLTGIIISNVKNLDMNQDRFTIVQIDNTIKIVKRDRKYISLMSTLDELRKLLDILQE